MIFGALQILKTADGAIQRFLNAWMTQTGRQTRAFARLMGFADGMIWVAMGCVMTLAMVQ